MRGWWRVETDTALLEKLGIPFTRPSHACIHVLEKVSHVHEGDVYKKAQGTMCKQLKCLPMGSWMNKIAGYS